MLARPKLGIAGRVVARQVEITQHNGANFGGRLRIVRSMQGERPYMLKQVMGRSNSSPQLIDFPFIHGDLRICGDRYLSIGDVK